MAKIEIPVYAQDSHDYLSSSDHSHLSLSSTGCRTYNYHEPMYGQDTGCIALAVEDSRLIGHLIVPAGTRTGRTAYDEDYVKVGRVSYFLHEAVECARIHLDGMSWRNA